MVDFGTNFWTGEVRALGPWKILYGESKKLRNLAQAASKIEAGIGNCLAKRFPILLRILIRAIFAYFLDLVTL